MRLRDVARNGDGDPDPPFRLPIPDVASLPAHVGDPEDILVLLGREPDHEVELGPVPAAREDAPAGLVDVLFADVLVDDVAHPLGARFGSEGEAGRLHLRDVVEHLFREPVSAEARDAERHPPRNEFLHHFLDERGDAGVVRGREGGERGFVVAALLDRRDHGVHDRLRIPLPDRPVDHAGLAETAALGAAAGDLDGGAVEDGLRGWNRRIVRERELVHVVEEGAGGLERDFGTKRPGHVGQSGSRADLALVERRAVEPSAGLQPDQHLLAIPDPRLAEPRVFAHEFRKALFGVPDEKTVHKGSHRFRLGRHRPAGDDERILRSPVVTPDRNPAELEHVEHVREGQLVLERKPHDVEIGERAARFEADERQAALAQFRLHVGPGAKDSFKREIRLVVHHLVKDLGAEMAHPDVIDVGKTKRHPGHDPLVRLLHHLKAFAAAVARGALHFVEEGSVGMAGLGHGWGWAGDCRWERRSPTRIAARHGRETAYPRPAQSAARHGNADLRSARAGLRPAHGASPIAKKGGDGLERRPLVGIARERETSAHDTAPYQPEAR